MSTYFGIAFGTKKLKRMCSIPPKTSVASVQVGLQSI